MTKRGSGSNSFDDNELRKYYNDYENCVWCGYKGADCFDHVISRKNKYTNSILNASPTHNQSCNISRHGEMHTFDNQVKMILKNMQRLQREKYTITELDTQFINEYPQAQKALELL